MNKPAFTVSVELHNQLIAHNQFLRATHVISKEAKEKLEEPTNPWPGLCGTILERLDGIDMKQVDKEELVVFYLSDDLTSDPYEYIKARYKLGALDAQEVIDRLEEFKILTTEYAY